MLAVVLGVALGLSLAAPPGPMNALIAREAARHGWRPAVRVGLGAPVADVLWLVVLLYGLGPYLNSRVLIQFAAVFGSLIMAFLAVQTFQTKEAEAADRPVTFTAGFVAALTNPYQAAWWLSGGFVFLQAQGIPGVTGLVVGIFVWVVVFAYLVAHGAQRWRWFGPLIRNASGVLLAIFALLLLAVGAGHISPDGVA